jgi:two-component system cell cycle sensor histidine kinase/response regulator CckA
VARSPEADDDVVASGLAASQRHVESDRALRDELELYRLIAESSSEALRQREALFSALLTNGSDLIAILSRSGDLLYQSPSAKSAFGYDPEELVGTSVFELLHPDDLARGMEVFAAAVADPTTTRIAEVRFRRGDGGWAVGECTVTNMLDDPAVQGIVVNTRDVTDRRRLEEEIRQTQKMEAVGQLAGGIAHDFNNLLTVIAGYGALALTRAGSSAAHDDLAQIQRAAERAAELTQQLLAFSRRQTLRPTVVQPNELVRDAVPMLERLIGTHIEFQVALDPGLHRVYADATGIEQIVMNLAVNAAQAMPTGGALTIATENAHVADTTARGLDVDPGDYATVSVTDTGSGMDPDTAAHAFEPFFTTKEPGVGTGLGLATVHGIAKQTGGAVRLDSEVGRGTTVTVYLPATDREPVADSRPRVSADVSGTEKVLVVDDEEPVRQVVAEMLAEHGYDVESATTPEDAIRMVEQGLRPDVLVTDVVMPKLGGPALAARLVELHPDLRVVLISGYTEHGLLAAEALSRSALFLRKPFTAEQLASAVRVALES